MKIIFSRKGFDSSNGGVPSPIFESGKLLSLPIPDFNSSVRYCDLTWESTNLGILVEDLTKKKISREHGVHHDPDLRINATARRTDWLPLFGQAKAAQSHLKNRGVDEGDIFLFFGWFRKVFKNNGCWSYVPNAPDIHVLFGWLQIQAVHNLSLGDLELEEWKKEHPHCQTNYKNNCLYVARRQLAIPELSRELSGGGIFTNYRSNLCLTAPNQSRSIWQLPEWFHPAEGKSDLSYHGDIRRWKKENSFAILDTAKIGQEFVLDCEDYPEAIPWLAKLFENQ
jgi:hypothetical protein